MIHLIPMYEKIVRADDTHVERIKRAKKIVTYLKRTYPTPKSELKYTTQFQFMVAVILSAQCTDKKVNKLTETLFKKYKRVDDFASANLATFTNDISSITFFHNKAKYIIGSAQKIRSDFGGQVPHTEHSLMTLPGVAYKTAHVVLGEVFNIWNGIATDTHVRRIALKFDLTNNTDLTKISKDLENLIPQKDWKYINNGLVLYGRYVCKALPHECAEHPLTKLWQPASNRWPKAK